MISYSISLRRLFILLASPLNLVEHILLFITFSSSETGDDVLGSLVLSVSECFEFVLH